MQMRNPQGPLLPGALLLPEYLSWGLRSGLQRNQVPPPLVGFWVSGVSWPGNECSKNQYPHHVCLCRLSSLPGGPLRSQRQRPKQGLGEGSQNPHPHRRGPPPETSPPGPHGNRLLPPPSADAVYIHSAPSPLYLWWYIYIYATYTYFICI